MEINCVQCKHGCAQCKPKCVECNLDFSDSMAFDKHRWSVHPSNEMEQHWAAHYKEGFARFKGSTFYYEDPYY
jgi:hypothetical protein